MAEQTGVSLYYLSIANDSGDDSSDDGGFDADLARAIDILDAHELARYKAFKNPRAQQTFLQARRIVKHSLSERLGCLPEEICFAYTDTEKPYLVSHSGWHFNISHCSEAIVVVLSKKPVGVDVERVSRCRKLWPRAEEFLNPHVKACIEKASNDEQRAALFAEHWSCTESYVKLKGSAIYREKDRVEAVEVTSSPWANGYTFEDTFFTALTMFDNVRVSLATEGAFPLIQLIDWVDYRVDGQTGEQAKCLQLQVTANG